MKRNSHPPKDSYTTAIKVCAHNYPADIDKFDGSNFFNNINYPSWLLEVAKIYSKEPKTVLEKILQYRNSFGYQLEKGKRS